MKLYRLIIFVTCYLLNVTTCCWSQDVVEDTAVIRVDSLVSGKPVKAGRDWATWKPEPKKALWLAVILPGAGQIYNRKFWKLPIIYGGFVGCAYAWSWNSMMYNDYKQAYLDLCDDDPNTRSYEEFIHSGIKITDANKEQYKTIFSNRKDKFRRYRDLSIICTIAVYAISIIDAYVDASLSQFDISNDLSLRVHPTYINTNPQTTSNPSNHLNCSNPLNSTVGGAWGVQCCLNF